MKKLIFFIFAICAILINGCSDNKRYDDILLRAEGLMRTNPDSSLAILNAADSLTPHFSLKQKMKYELLRTNAQSLTNVAFTSDKTTKRLADYYDQHGTANEKMMAKYLLGLTYMNMKEWPIALQCFQDAISKADTTSNDCDYYTLCRVYAQVSDVYTYQLMPNEEMAFLKLSEKYAWMAKDTLSALTDYAKTANCYEQLNNIDSLISISEKSALLFKKYGYKKEEASMIGNAVRGSIAKGDYAKAKRYTDYYIANSGKFDAKGNIIKGFENFYYTLGLYYTNINKPDSAEYYFLKELREGKDYDNQISGSYGLSKLYQKTGKYGLSSKYALRAYEINDSVYIKTLAQNLQYIQSNYDYRRQQQIAKDERTKRNQADTRSFFLAIIIIMLVVIGYLLQKKRKIKEAYKIESYKRNIETLGQAEKDLLTLKSVENESLNKMIEEKTKLVEKLNNEILKYKRLYKYNDSKIKIKDTEIYNRFRTYLGKNAMKSPTPKDWEELIDWANKKLPSFYSFFINRYSLNDTEYEICILTRFGFSPSEIGSLMGYEKAAVSMCRLRIVRKITGKEGSAKMLDEIVKRN